MNVHSFLGFSIVIPMTHLNSTMVPAPYPVTAVWMLVTLKYNVSKHLGQFLHQSNPVHSSGFRCSFSMFLFWSWRTRQIPEIRWANLLTLRSPVVPAFFIYILPVPRNENVRALCKSPWYTYDFCKSRQLSFASISVAYDWNYGGLFKSKESEEFCATPSASAHCLLMASLNDHFVVTLAGGT